MFVEQKDVNLTLPLPQVTLDLKSPSADRSVSSSELDYGFNQLKSSQQKKGGILKTSGSSKSSSKEHFNFGTSSASASRYNNTASVKTDDASSEEQLNIFRRGSLRVGLEELETANCHLRRMVDSLFVELEHCQRENSQLRGRVREGCWLG